MARCVAQIGAACSFNYQCETGSCVDAVCALPGGRNDACQSDANCEAGLTSLQFRNEQSPYCELKGSFPTDARCSVDAECLNRACTSNFCSEPS